VLSQKSRKQRGFQRLRRLLLPIAVAMGVALTGTSVSAKRSMRDWVERALDNIMQVHFYGAKVVDSRRGAHWETLVPDDWDEKTTVKPVVPRDQLKIPLKCEQFRPQSFRNWHKAINGTRKQWESVPAFAYWDIPTFLAIRVSRKYWFFDDMPVLISMVVIGDTFEIEHILNDRRDRISKEILYKTHDLHEYRSREIEENYLYERPIKVLARRQCEGFRIFDFEVGDHV